MTTNDLKACLLRCNLSGIRPGVIGTQPINSHNPITARQDTGYTHTFTVLRVTMEMLLIGIDLRVNRFARRN